MEGPAAALRPASSILPLEARGLAFEAGGKRLIDGVDLAFAGGSLTVIVGPNGAGKSLLLRLLHGLIAPTAGTVLWSGRPADKDVRRRQAMVFQRPVLLRRSAAANVRYALKARRLRDEECRQRAAEALSVAGLAHLAEMPARVLSGGEQQRLALARAMALAPEILFLDEPTASLDPSSTLAVEGMVRRAHSAGTKIVLVTHDLGQTRRLADDVVFLHRGRIEESAAANDFFDRPRSERTRAFIAGRIVL